MMYINQLFHLEDVIKAKHSSFDAIKKARLEKEKLIVEGFLAWLDKQNPVRGSRMDKAVTYIQNRRSYLMTYLEDDVLMEVVRTLTANNDLEAGLNPALGEKNIALQRLYEFYVDFFRDESRFATLIDRIAYDLSYGNPELKQVLTNIYNNTPGYDGAMRKLQSYFRAFFGSDVFTKILISELNQVMTEMVNKSFIII